MEFLKDVLGNELYGKVAEKLEGNDKVRLANLAGGQYVDKEKLDEAQKTIGGLKKSLEAREQDIAELKKSIKGGDEISKQLSDLQAKYEADTRNLNEKLKENSLASAIDIAVLKARGKNPKAIKALLDKSKLSLSGDGNVEGLPEALDSLKNSDPYLFEQTKMSKLGTGFHGGKPDSEKSLAAETFREALKG